MTTIKPSNEEQAGLSLALHQCLLHDRAIKPGITYKKVSERCIAHDVTKHDWQHKVSVCRAARLAAAAS
jgi:hypothetical protein